MAESPESPESAEAVSSDPKPEMPNGKASPEEQGSANAPTEQNSPARAASALDELPKAPPSVGKVFGETRVAAQKPSHLKDYKDTVMVGGDPKREAPPPPPPGSPANLGQTMPTAQPQAPAAPRIDKELIAKAEAQAQEMLAQAQAQVQQMMAGAEQQIQEQAQAAHQQAAEQGYQEGLQAGTQAGQEQGQAETQQRNEQLKMEFVELVMARRKVLAGIEPQIVDLAIKVAEKVVGMELESGREIITGIVRQGLSTLKERDEVLIRVNPAEVEAVKKHQAEYETTIEGLKRFEIIPDGAIEVGSCAIETNLGNVDARISTQFEAVRQGLEEISKIRTFESQEKLETTPVDVPGDPEFHARILREKAEAKAAAAAAAAEH